jgi:hypothetical protein
MAVELITFVLGALFAVVIQVLVSRMTLARDQRKESWMRRLNSYQDFYQSTSQLLDLWRAGIDVSDDRSWDILMTARKAAYDAAVYDPDQRDQAERMQALSVELVRLAQEDQRDPEQLNQLAAESRAILDTFIAGETALRLLRSSGRARWIERRS